MRTVRSRSGLPSLLFAILTLSGCASLLDIEEGQPKPGGTSGGGGGSKAGASGVGGAAAGNAAAGNAAGSKGGAAGIGQGGGGTSSGGAGAGQGGTSAGIGGASGGNGGIGGSAGLGGKAGNGGISAGTGGVASGNGGTSAGQGGTGAGQGGTSAGNAGAGGSAGSTSGGDGGSTGGGNGGATSGGAAGADGGSAGVGGSGAGVGGIGAGGVIGAGAGGSDAGSGGFTAGAGGSSGSSAGAGGSGAVGCKQGDIPTCTTPGVGCDGTTTEIVLQQIAAGDRFTCALATVPGRNYVWCWGDNAVGQLARPAACASSGVALRVPLPAPMDTAPGAILIAGPTADAACLLAANNVYCWGQVAGLDATQWGVTQPTSNTFATPISGSVGRNFVFAKLSTATYVRGNDAMSDASQVDFPKPDQWTTIPGGPKVAASSAASCAATAVSGGGGGGFGGGTQQVSLDCAGAALGCLLADEAGPCADAGTITSSNWKYTPPNSGQCCGSPTFELEMSDSVGCIAAANGSGGSPPTLQCWGADVQSPLDAPSSPVPTELPYSPSGAGGGTGSGGNMAFAVGDGFVAQARGYFANPVQIHGQMTSAEGTPILINDPPFRLTSGSGRLLTAGRRHLCGIASVSNMGAFVQCVGSNEQRQAGSPAATPVNSSSARFINFEKL